MARKARDEGWYQCTSASASRAAVSTSASAAFTVWQFAAPDDPRLTIEPDIALPVKASDYFGGRDPVMDAVLARP